MKNLIYSIVDKNFIKQFKYFYHSLMKVNSEIPLLCITPADLEIKFSNIFQFKLNDFDYRYTGKYQITKWEKFDNYENFLYLDADIYFQKDPLEIFKEIEKNCDMIHGVKEGDSIINASLNHRIENDIIYKDSPYFNAGTFGFNKKLKTKIQEFALYVFENKNSESIHDQPLFNKFFRNTITENLSKHIEIFEVVKPINPKITHLAGSFYNSLEKEKIYKRFFRKETRGEFFNLIPSKAIIGLFNCENYYPDEVIKNPQKEKQIEIKRDMYDVPDSYYDLIYIDRANNINHLIEMIRKIYPKVKKGGVISSVSGNKDSEKIIKEFILKSNLDFFLCFEDEAFYTIKI